MVLKADVTKAHRRVKVLKKDWRFQVASLGEEWWVNKVGTYGMASAQPFCSGSSTRLSLKWTGTLSSSTTSCGCFEARGQ